MDKNIENTYRQMLANLDIKKYQEPDDQTVVFAALNGSKKPDLMLVGRATNGWHIYYNKTKNKLYPNERNGLDWVLNELKNQGQLTAYTDKWINEEKYNLNRSQFWNVGRAVARQFLNKDQTEFENIVYTNLYKVASSNGNPSQKLMYATDKKCIEIFKLELDYFQPKHVLILTGRDWAEPFLKEMNFEKVQGFEFIEGKASYNEISILVAVHPQGKNVAKVIDEIKLFLR